MLNIREPKILMKFLLVSFFFYMILEGVFRKWIFPNISTQIYFIKDFLLLLIYLIAIKYNFILKLRFTKFFIFIVIVLSLVGSVGYDFNKQGIISYILGLRSYWLFMPLFLIVIHVFNQKDIIKFFKYNVYLTIPFFILIYLQTILPDTSILNSGYDGMLQSPERPSGYFTYTTQNSYYFLFMFFTFCVYVLSKDKIFLKDFIYLAFINLLLISIMILLKSRSVYIVVFVTVIYSSLFLILSNTEAMLKLKKLSIILFVTFFSFQISSEIIFTKEYKYSEVRINTDPYYDLEIVTHNKDKEIDMEIKILGLNVNLLEKLNLSEEKETVESFCSKYSSLCRIANELYIVPAINDSTSFGKGLGAGTAAVAIYNNFTFYNLGETENQRIVRELGYIFGTFLYITKILIVIILNVFALLKFRDKNKLIFTPILVFTSVQLCLGAITYTTSFISFIFWFSLGILFLSFNKDKNFYK